MANKPFTLKLPALSAADRKATKNYVQRLDIFMPLALNPKPPAKTAAKSTKKGT